jgi:hypothetical protein
MTRRRKSKKLFDKEGGMPDHSTGAALLTAP